jgi:hypothetical protein
MQKGLSARIGERDVVPLRIDLAIPSPDTTDNAYTESCQQRMRRFKASGCIVVARDNDR